MPKTSSTDRIEKKTLLRAPRSRVWRALTDPTEFGKWFQVQLPPAPFQVGARVSGRITYPGYEHLLFEVDIVRIEPERLLSWRWFPGIPEPGVDASKEPWTLVEFTLSEAPEGTLLTVVESGFDKVPPSYRDKAFRMNDDGWAEQMLNIERHVSAGS
jgi:uncharacterized protein YndB with AHSA1/START domain